MDPLGENNVKTACYCKPLPKCNCLNVEKCHILMSWEALLYIIYFFYYRSPEILENIEMEERRLWEEEQKRLKKQKGIKL